MTGAPLSVVTAAACALVASATLACSPGRQDAGAATDTTATPVQVDDALERAYGVHPGQRRNHTKGLCALGTFTGDLGAAVYSRSGLFVGDTIPVVARFSLAGGDPDEADASPSPRGMALEFRLPSGARQHMTMINTPMFFARTPQTFLDKMVALAPVPATGKPDPAAMQRFAATHPDNAGQAKFLAEHNPPASFATAPYFGIHTFKFLNDRGETTLVRWRFAPDAGEHALTDAQMRDAPHDFLAQELIARTKQAPARWTMWLAIGQPGDVENDPTVLWPADRKQVRAGALTITSAMPQTGAACDGINYDPLVLTDGIVPSSDPVLLFRSPSYAVSFDQRRAGK
jgi:catalase